MALDDLTEPLIRQYEQQLLSRLPASGPIGNVTLRGELSNLGWCDELYWKIRKGLIDTGELAVGGGKGGSVHRVSPVAMQAVTLNGSAAESKQSRHGTVRGRGGPLPADGKRY